MFESIKYQSPGKLALLDQRLLPKEEKWLEIKGVEQGGEAIKSMVVRGAPAIATAACFSICVELAQLSDTQKNWEELKSEFFNWVNSLLNTRPTAVNLLNELECLKKLVEQFPLNLGIQEIFSKCEGFALDVAEKDRNTCEKIGEQGLNYLIESLPKKSKFKLLTHCNTGSLATSGIGTAIGIIKVMHQKGLVEKVYVDETRPWLQGARLTAFELLKEGIPCELIVDSCAAWMMSQDKVDAVLVGADRIAKNGDTANKIGTYSLAVASNFHSVPFLVAAPKATFDETLDTGDDFEIELRNENEIKMLAGVQVAPQEVKGHNPSFDITPGSLIDAIVHEDGVWRAKDIEKN